MKASLCGTSGQVLRRQTPLHFRVRFLRPAGIVEGGVLIHVLPVAREIWGEARGASGAAEDVAQTFGGEGWAVLSVQVREGFVEADGREVDIVFERVHVWHCC